MKVPANNLLRHFEEHQQEYENKALEILRSGSYILGDEVDRFEKDFASYIGTSYCVGLGNCLDALWLSFRVLGIGAGDEVIVQANTYIASVMGITINDATPVFVEPDAFHSIDADKIEERITDKTKAILVVHLYGTCCEMDKIVAIAKKHNLYLVEDCAQSHGATYQGQMTGSFGDIHPKILAHLVMVGRLPPTARNWIRPFGCIGFTAVRSAIIIRWSAPIPGSMNFRPGC